MRALEGASASSVESSGSFWPGVEMRSDSISRSVSPKPAASHAVPQPSLCTLVMRWKASLFMSPITFVTVVSRGAA